MLGSQLTVSERPGPRLSQRSQNRLECARIEVSRLCFPTLLLASLACSLLRERPTATILSPQPSDASIISSVSFFMVTKSSILERLPSSFSFKTSAHLLYQSPDCRLYQYNMDVVISAKVTQTDGKVVGYALPAFVYEPNVAPQFLTLSSSRS